MAAQMLTLLAARLEIDEHLAAAALEAVHATGPAARDLRDYLRDHSAPLSCEASDVPRSVVHLAHALRGLGVETIVLPVCGACRMPRRDLEHLRPSGRVCESCRSRERMVACAGCGRPAHLSSDSARRTGRCRACRSAPRPPEHVCAECSRREGHLFTRPDGLLWCAPCRRAHTPAPPPTYRVETCAECERTSRIFARLEDGRGLCQRCYRPPQAECVVCGRSRPVHKRTDAGPTCRACCALPPRICGVCGQVAPWRVRPRDARPGLCAHCYRLPRGECAVCGHRRRLRVRTRTCVSCSARKESCDRCGRTREIIVRWPIGNYCTTCYQGIRADVRPCPACGGVHPLVGLDEQNRPICPACAGLDYDYACRRCGTTGMLQADGLCIPCLAIGRINLLLTGPDGDIPANLQPLARALATAGTPGAVYQWLAPRAPATRTITALVRHAGPTAKDPTRQQPLTHAMLDLLPVDATTHRLRAVLVHAGVLAPRAEYLERITAWLDDALAPLPGDQANLVRAWAQWTTLRRARHRLPAKAFTEAAAHAVRSNILGAVDFLTWINASHLPLGKIDQPDLDVWLTRTDTTRNPYLAREFLRWARNRGHVRPGVVVPARSVRRPLEPLPDDERWHHLDRCLTDQSLPDDVRAAAALLLLFGIPVSRIIRLRAADLADHDDTTSLRLRDHDLTLPPAVAELLHRCRRPDQEWIFPGAHPGTHATARLGHTLRRHGFPHAARARATALIDLSAQIPAPVLADLLGINLHTALAWSRYGQDDWAAYLHARNPAE